MPTTYAHDLFGKKVYQKLTKEMKEVIRRNGELYRIGLHGPDIFFYFLLSKNPVSRFGSRMHHEKARAFFEQGLERVRETQSPALLAYLLGFGCHYLLDSACHPYVNRTAAAGVVSHTLLEKEFDRALMEETGKDSLHFYPSDCIVPRLSHAKMIHQVIPCVRTGNIYLSLRMMKPITNAMVCDDKGRRRAYLGKIAALAGKKNAAALLDHFMTRIPVTESRQPVDELKKLFEKALAEAPQYLEELYARSKDAGQLSRRFDKTYSG